MVCREQGNGDPGSAGNDVFYEPSAARGFLRARKLMPSTIPKLKTRICFAAGVVLSLLISYGLGYHNGWNRALYGTIHVGPDSKDITPMQVGSTAIFDPYFTRDNPIPGAPK